MVVTPPTNVGPYRVDREIGRGGMGVVFLAHDTRLDRWVALKALPDEVAADPEGLQRFEREAKVLASVSHPNIAGIYGVEETAGRRYLALEYVEGESLAERIGRGPLSLEESIEICRQIAAGVEAAHEAGIIHRDLKPHNVVIDLSERVKVVDFGLAKGRVAGGGALSDSPSRWGSPALPSSPTMASPGDGTIPGVVLGTAPYLSPEQARGRAVDRRTDIWSFGCILYECLTGARAFQGETASDTIAKILEGNVNWSLLPKATPPRIVELLARCLDKDPRQRLRDIGDARLALEEIKSGRFAANVAGAAPSTTPGVAARARALILGGMVAIGAFLGASAWNALRPAPHSGALRPAHFSVALPRDFRYQGAAVTPNGDAFLLVGSLGTGKGSEPVPPRIYVRRVDQSAFEPLPGTDGAISVIVSPDSRWIEFISAPRSAQSGQPRLLKAPIDGSVPPVSIRNVDPSWDGGAAWLASGDLIMSVGQGAGYVRLTADGTESAPKGFALPGFKGDLRPQNPPLPGDRGILLRAIWYEGGVYRQGIAILDLKSGKSKMLIRDGGSPQYSPTGHLLFTRQGTLLAVPFDLAGLRIEGEPTAIMGDLRSQQQGLHAVFGLASNGMLVYAPGSDVGRDRRLMVVRRDGTVSDWSSERQAWDYVITASRDGGRCVGSVNNADAITELWVSERGRAASYRVPVKAGADCIGPIWSPDGREVAYWQQSQSAEDGVYVSTVDGTAPPRRVVSRASATAFMAPGAWTPDGSTILGSLIEGNRFAIYSFAAHPAQGSVSEPKRVFPEGANRAVPDLSPDGRLLAYQSDESGRFEAYVCPWNGQAPSGRPLLVSAGGSRRPMWGADSRTLYYPSPDRKLMAVRVTTAPHLQASAPSAIWDLEALRISSTPSLGPIIDILPDGSLLAVQRGEGEDDVTRFDVILNFSEVVKQRTLVASR